MPEEFEITITAPEPPAGGTNVMVRYIGGMRTGTFSLARVAEALISGNSR